jgi:hypothetical protein
MYNEAMTTIKESHAREAKMKVTLEKHIETTQQNKQSLEE